MSRNTMLAFVSLLLIALVGGAGAFWAYKKYKKKQNQEFLFEGTMGTAKEGLDPVTFKSVILNDVVMDTTIEKHQLIKVWDVSDAAAAKAKLKEKFSVKISDGMVKVTYQDKDKELARAILETIANSYYDKYKKAQESGSLPPTPPE